MFLEAGKVLGKIVSLETSFIPTQMNFSKSVLKKYLILAFGFSAFAVVTTPFDGWQNLKNNSPDIVLARCIKTPEGLDKDTNGYVIERTDGLIKTEINVFYVLKGTSNLGPAKLLTFQKIFQGQNYLVFCFHYGNAYQAVEKYRLVPLEPGFETNQLAGKSLDECISIILAERLNQVKREIKEAEQEKERLELAVKK